MPNQILYLLILSFIAFIFYRWIRKISSMPLANTLSHAVIFIIFIGLIGYFAYLLLKDFFPYFYELGYTIGVVAVGWIYFVFTKNIGSNIDYRVTSVEEYIRFIFFLLFTIGVYLLFTRVNALLISEWKKQLFDEGTKPYFIIFILMAAGFLYSTFTFDYYRQKEKKRK